MSERFFLGRVLGTVWGAVDGFRKILHLLLLLGIFLVLLAALAVEPPRVPRAAALVLAPQGILVDQLSGDPFERAVARARGIEMQETLLKDLSMPCARRRTTSASRRSCCSSTG
jgi:protease-4